MTIDLIVAKDRMIIKVDRRGAAGNVKGDFTKVEMPLTIWPQSGSKLERRNRSRWGAHRSEQARRRGERDVRGVKNFDRCAAAAAVSGGAADGGGDAVEALEEMGIKTIANLRAYHSDRAALRGTKLGYVHFMCRAYGAAEAAGGEVFAVDGRFKEVAGVRALPAREGPDGDDGRGVSDCGRGVGGEGGAGGVAAVWDTCVVSDDRAVFAADGCREDEEETEEDLANW